MKRTLLLVLQVIGIFVLAFSCSSIIDEKKDAFDVYAIDGALLANAIPLVYLLACRMSVFDLSRRSSCLALVNLMTVVVLVVNPSTMYLFGDWRFNLSLMVFLATLAGAESAIRIEGCTCFTAVVCIVHFTCLLALGFHFGSGASALGYVFDAAFVSLAIARGGLVRIVFSPPKQAVRDVSQKLLELVEKEQEEEAERLKAEQAKEEAERLKAEKDKEEEEQRLKAEEGQAEEAQSLEANEKQELQANDASNGVAANDSKVADASEKKDTGVKETELQDVGSTSNEPQAESESVKKERDADPASRRDDVRQMLKDGSVLLWGMLFDKQMRTVVRVEPGSEAWKKGIRRGWELHERKGDEELSRIICDKERRPALVFRKHSMKHILTILLANCLTLTTVFSVPCSTFDVIYPLGEERILNNESFHQLHDWEQNGCPAMEKVVKRMPDWNFSRVSMHCVMQHNGTRQALYDCERKLMRWHSSDVSKLAKRFYYMVKPNGYPDLLLGNFTNTYLEDVSPESPLVVAAFMSSKFVLLSRLYSDTPEALQRLLIPVTATALLVTGLGLWLRIFWALASSFKGLYLYSDEVASSGFVRLTAILYPFMKFFFGQELFQLNLLTTQLCVFGLRRSTTGQDERIIETAAQVNRPLLVFVAWTYQYLNRVFQKFTGVTLLPDEGDLLQSPKRDMDVGMLISWSREVEKTVAKELQAKKEEEEKAKQEAAETADDEEKQKPKEEPEKEGDDNTEEKAENKTGLWGSLWNVFGGKKAKTADEEMSEDLDLEEPLLAASQANLEQPKAMPLIPSKTQVPVAVVGNEEEEEKAEEETETEVIKSMETAARKAFLVIAFFCGRLPGVILAFVQGPLALFSLCIIIMPPALGYVYIFMVLPLAAVSMKPFADVMRRMMRIGGDDSGILKLGAFLFVACFMPPLLQSIMKMILRFSAVDSADPEFYWRCLLIWWEQSLEPYKSLDFNSIWNFLKEDISVPDVVSIMSI
eukprot:TRINITY_DN12489_c0_g1_i2.p1 TRINITY_DN12489_c0_g1~~TRINITY_DN12489_c0_g1_i2.p1  ORF type:complete len:1002 (+),score=266.39 TRINITY_DN12489_c0_g1_i2:36-3008(+)